MSQPQVIVVGAGPAGTTTATLLAKQGISVRVLEKAIFPRWHIGESLLPADLPIFERLGFVPDKSNYVYKVGAEFINEETGDFALYRFDDALEGTPPHAWQVERARFDTDLATIAQDNGVEVQFGVKVRHIEISDERVSVEAVTDGGVTTHHARYLVDATGQDAFLGRRKRTIEPIKGFGVVAVATVFEDLDPAVTAELEEQGNIKILIREDGWGWVIPLRGRVSIGMVTQERGLGQAMLDEGIDESPLLTRLTQGATRGQTWVLRNFAYLNRDAYGRRWGCVGDAAAFLDPVFSSGVSLAMFGGQGVADVVGPAILEGQEDQPDLLEPHAIRMRQAYDAFGSLIRSFYHTNLVKHLFFAEDPDLLARSGLISLLAGDVFREDNAFQNTLMRGRRRWRSVAKDLEAAKAIAEPRVEEAQPAE